MHSLIDLVYPKICVVCKNSLKNSPGIDSLVCTQCWGKIKKNTPPFCHICGRQLKSFAKNICPGCTRKPLHFDRAFSACAYEGVVKELIHAFKYQNKDYLGQPLSRLMIEFIREYALPMEFLDAIIPIPLHKTRLREREFNQAEVLSTHIAAQFNKGVLRDSLRRNRPTQTQTGLEDALRFSNVKGSFSVTRSEHIKGKNLLLIDDVFTTGATASEAAYALKNAGANIVFILTLAN